MLVALRQTSIAALLLAPGIPSPLKNLAHAALSSPPQLHPHHHDGAPTVPAGDQRRALPPSQLLPHQVGRGEGGDALERLLHPEHRIGLPHARDTALMHCNVYLHRSGRGIQKSLPSAQAILCSFQSPGYSALLLQQVDPGDPPGRPHHHPLLHCSQVDPGGYYGRPHHHPLLRLHLRRHQHGRQLRYLLDRLLHDSAGGHWRGLHLRRAVPDHRLCQRRGAELWGHAHVLRRLPAPPEPDPEVVVVVRLSLGVIPAMP